MNPPSQSLRIWIWAMALWVLSGLPVGAQYCNPYQVLVIGDSWSAGMVGSSGAYNTRLDEAAIPNTEAKGNMTALAGTTTGWWVSIPTSIERIVNELETYPCIRAVHIQLGGNDFLWTWKADWTTQQETDYFNQIRDNMIIIIETILAIRPDVPIVLNSYDYLALQNCPDILDLENNPGAYEFNEALSRLDWIAKKEVADLYPQVKFANNYGIHHALLGYPGVGIIAGTTPMPGGEATGYVPLMGGSPIYWANPAHFSDCIHLTGANYYYVLGSAVNDYIAPWIAHAHAHPRRVDVDFGFDGMELGTTARPFNSLSEASQMAPAGGTVLMSPGDSPESVRITRAMRLESTGGSARIGAVVAPDMQPQSAGLARNAATQWSTYH